MRWKAWGATCRYGCPMPSSPATTCRHFSQGYSVPPDFSVELALQQQGVWPVAGVDEAGCGPLAGPVVAAAVILNLHDIPAGLDDSKKLAAKAREKLFEDINLRAACIGIAVISASKIDIINIRNAALLAMQRAIAALSAAPAHVLADGRNVPPGLACSCRAIVRGGWSQLLHCGRLNCRQGDTGPADAHAGRRGPQLRVCPPYGLCHASPFGSLGTVRPLAMAPHELRANAGIRRSPKANLILTPCL